MPAPIAAVGSMMVQGIFKGGSLLSGLSSMVGKFKGAQQEGKSTGTEMKRMTGHAHMLRNALALIGVGGFTALLTQTPALAGGLVKIKTEMMLIANAVGRVLKPAVDSVATILQGIRTGDWSKVKAGVVELAEALISIGSVVIDVVLGEGTAAKAKEDFSNWVIGIQEAWNTGTLFDVAKAIIWPPTKWVYNHLKDIFITAGEQVGRWAMIKGQLFGQNVKQKGVSEALRDTQVIGKGMQLAGYDRAYQMKEDKIAAQGGPSEKAGWIWDQPKAIENQTNNFNIDMQGITGNIEDPGILRKLADAVSNALRDEQKAVTY